MNGRKRIPRGHRAGLSWNRCFQVKTSISVISVVSLPAADRSCRISGGRGSHRAALGMVRREPRPPDTRSPVGPTPEDTARRPDGSTISPQPRGRPPQIDRTVLGRRPVRCLIGYRDSGRARLPPSREPAERAGSAGASPSQDFAALIAASRTSQDHARLFRDRGLARIAGPWRISCRRAAFTENSDPDSTRAGGLCFESPDNPPPDRHDSVRSRYIMRLVLPGVTVHTPAEHFAGFEGVRYMFSASASSLGRTDWPKNVPDPGPTRPLRSLNFFLRARGSGTCFRPARLRLVGRIGRKMYQTPALQGRCVPLTISRGGTP